MRITICSSAFFAKETYEIKQKLEEEGHDVSVYPQEIKINGKIIHTTDYYKMRKYNLTDDLLKIKTMLINKHIEKIRNSDAILVLNLDKDGKKGYIGGNTFLEMGIAYHLNKKIFLWKKPSESLPYYEEIIALNPIIINENIEEIR
ncbi:MAG: hypothetical protein DRP10_01415 [Candidatus Aenigmatarchaeota archaeon]|nr:MAG: hypothetical protein DRP10_01415 [Candidatus Aenigmarchaeota archaeon]